MGGKLKTMKEKEEGLSESILKPHRPAFPLFVPFDQPPLAPHPPLPPQLSLHFKHIPWEEG
jgi:hypothetical protein